MPIVVSGVKTVRKSVGRVVDFCPICRDMRAFELEHIGNSAHVYGVALSDGDTLYYEANCQTCGVYFSTHARKYSSVCTDESAPVEQLLAKCGPSRPEQIKNEREQAERMRTGALTAEERRAMMAETFEFLNEHARHRRNRVGNEHKTNGGCMASIVVFSCVYLGWYGWNQAFPEHSVAGVKALCILGSTFVAGVGYTVWQIYGDTRRFAISKLLPQLAIALKPLNPTPDELNALHARFLKRKFTLARCLSAADIEHGILGTRTNVTSKNGGT